MSEYRWVLDGNNVPQTKALTEIGPGMYEDTSGWPYRADETFGSKEEALAEAERRKSSK